MDSGHQVTALSRNAAKALHNMPVLEDAFDWDLMREYAPMEAFDGVDAVIHLAGESVAGGRWTKEKKDKIYNSRIQGTHHLVGSMMKAETPPKALISASAIGYYGDRDDETLTESSAPAHDFLANVCKDWETEAGRAREKDIRVASLRIGIVLGPDGGALDAMLLPAKLGANGPLGSGKQWWSWIHREDLVGIIEHTLTSNVDGPINATSPNPVQQKEFAKVLGKVMHRPSFIPAPTFALKTILGEFSVELLSSKKVIPEKIQEAGYTFKFPDLEKALRQILEK